MLGTDLTSRIPVREIPRMGTLAHESGPDALPIGAPHAGPILPVGQPIGFGFDAARELYRMHTQPHLYDDWHRDFADDMFDAMLPDGMTGWDCNRCRMTVVTADDTCPACA